MKPWEIITRLESDNSRLFKESVIAQAVKENNVEFFDGIGYALDSFTTFGVKKVPEKINENGNYVSWTDFGCMCQRLINRELTGNLARDAIEQMMNDSTKDQWNNWYRRILIKDLRCGVSEKTVNNVVPPLFSIPTFSCQLAHDSAKHESKVSGKKMIENKLDGVRVITIVYPDGRVDQYSRNGKELLNFQKIKDQISAIASTFTQPMVLDGEVMSSSFQDLMKQVHRKDNVNAKDAILNLFDILPLDDFKKGEYDVKQKERTEYLTKWYESNISKLPNVSVLNHALIDLDTKEGQKLFKMYNKSAIENGYEGLMIKDPEAIYECKRSVAWLKLKPYIEVSLTVISTEEGTGKNLGKMGALICEGVDDGKLIQVNVGSGFTDLERDEFWSCKVDGHIVEVRADAITQNQDGSYSLRFPRFKCFRGFKVGEKI